MSRLVSRGDGTRRITLKLNPEALGDVRVVLTVRQGEVHVRMAGNEQAQRALQSGSSELHQLLERAGATSSQVVVGQTTTQHHAGQGDASAGRDLFGARDGLPQEGRRDTHDDRTAGTRTGGTTARDGDFQGAHPRSLANQGTRSRLAGVDVTM